MKTLSVFCTFIAAMYSITIYSQAGNLDPEFGGGDGLVKTALFSDLHCQGNDIAVDQNGRIVVCGTTQTPGGLEHAVLLCYTPDGTPDNSFNSSGKMIIQDEGYDTYGNVVAIQPDGKIVTAFPISNSGEKKLAVHRYNPDGSPDNSFDGDGISVVSFGAKSLTAYALELQKDNKIVVGGYAKFENDTFGFFHVTRFHADGSLDSEFDNDGFVMTRVGESWSDIYDLVIQPDDKILAVGYAVFNGNDDFAIVRYNNDGSLDTGFDGDGIAHLTFSAGDDRSIGAVLQQDGKIVMGGYAVSSVTNFNEFAVARLNANGTSDATFHGDGMNTIFVSGQADAAKSILLQPDGKILLGGYVHSNVISTSFEIAFVRLNENGIPDTTFSEDGIAVFEDPNTSGYIQDMALQPDGKIVATGVVRTDGINAILLARLISGITVSAVQPELLANDITLFPNPVTDQLELEYHLDKNELLGIQLCDMTGRFIQELLPPTNQGPGYHRMKLEIDKKPLYRQLAIKKRGKVN